MKKMLVSLVMLSFVLSACGALGDTAGDLQATAISLGIQQTALAEASEVTSEAPTENPAASSAAELLPTETSPAPTATSPAPTNAPSDTPEPSAEPFEVPNWPLVRSGDSGPLVYAIQYLLRSHGYNLTADGQFGVQTLGEVSTFQNSKGLNPDGIVGPLTWAELIKGNQIKKNDTGPEVRAAQYLLRHRHDYNNVNVDGDFGPITDNAVRDFQGNYDLQVDGIIGPNSWQALVAIKP